MEVEIVVPAPLAHQKRIDQSPARFKLLHHGRRFGKDRVAFKGAIAGHGPDTDDGPMFAGAAQGWWIGWVVRDFTQGLGIWREEFLPRFEPARPQVTVNKSELRVGMPNGGGILMCTAENIDSLRGLGKRIKGLVINEAAWFDLEQAWTGVLRALLVDNMGWAYFMSTPNSHSDGNPAGLAPSYFNRMAIRAKSGSLGDEWAVFGGDLRENPKINRAEAESFLRELIPGSLKYREEGLGELVAAGAGLAFPAWDPDIHLVAHRDTPAEWALVLGMDWGIRSDATIVAARVGPHQELEMFREWNWKDKDAYEAGYDFALSLVEGTLPRWPDWMVADSAMNERTGVGGTTILTEFQAGVNDALKPYKVPPLHVMPAPKGPGSRAAGFNQVTKVLNWGPRLADGSLPANRMPQLRVRKTAQGEPSCPKLVGDLAGLPLDPKKGDDVEKEKSGLGHAYDALMYLLAMTLPRADRLSRDIPEHIHPGFLPSGQRRSRDRTPEVEAEEQRITLEYQAKQAGVQLGGRYGRRPRG